MVFKTDKQRRAFFAQTQRVQSTPIVVFSFRTPGKKLGKFDNLKDAFKEFPSERKAFMRVRKFRKETGIRVNTIAEIKKIKRQQK